MADQNPDLEANRPNAEEIIKVGTIEIELKDEEQS